MGGKKEKKTTVKLPIVVDKIMGGGFDTVKINILGVNMNFMHFKCL